MPLPVLLVPGVGNSGPRHWQSLWQVQHGFQRVVMPDWEHPNRSEWVEALERAVSSCDEAPLLIAHSLGCLTVAHWAVTTRRRAQGALLVAPPDPAGSEFPATARGFESIPAEPLPFPSIVVASENDRYGSVDFAERCAGAWQARFVSVGRAGHINADSGLGSWPEGFALFGTLRGDGRSTA